MNLRTSDGSVSFPWELRVLTFPTTRPSIKFTSLGFDAWCIGDDAEMILSAVGLLMYMAEESGQFLLRILMGESLVDGFDS